LVLDAGTGLRNLSRVLDGAPFRGTILLSHLHWDHTHGLPFFSAGDRDDAITQLFLPEQGVDPVELLARTMSPPHFPIGPLQLRGEWSFGVIDRGSYRFEGFDVLVREIPHKGGKTLGFRVSDGRRSLAYLSDHAPQDRGAGDHGFGALHDDALDLARDVDVLVHDAQYTARELPRRGSFGHAAFEYSVELAAAAGARKVLLFHHDPSRTDPEVEAILYSARVQAAKTAVAVELARDNSLLTIGPEGSYFAP
jgi:phosphoribosyl 1,2-cyclic phosphodiesterase